MSTFINTIFYVVVQMVSTGADVGCVAGNICVKVNEFGNDPPTVSLPSWWFSIYNTDIINSLQNGCEISGCDAIEIKHINEWIVAQDFYIGCQFSMKESVTSTVVAIDVRITNTRGDVIEGNDVIQSTANETLWDFGSNFVDCSANTSSSHSTTVFLDEATQSTAETTAEATTPITPEATTDTASETTTKTTAEITTEATAELTIELRLESTEKSNVILLEGRIDDASTTEFEENEAVTETNENTLISYIMDSMEYVFVGSLTICVMMVCGIFWLTMRIKKKRKDAVNNTMHMVETVEAVGGEAGAEVVDDCKRDVEIVYDRKQDANKSEFEPKKNDGDIELDESHESMYQEDGLDMQTKGTDDGFDMQTKGTDDGIDEFDQNGPYTDCGKTKL